MEREQENRSHAATVAWLGALGDRMADFGQTEATRHIAAEAVAANPWFTEADIVFAVRAVREQMLDRVRLAAWLAAYDEPAGAPLRVAIIMAGNIPLVGFADLLYVLADFVKRGYLQKEGRSYRIADRPALERLSR